MTVERVDSRRSLREFIDLPKRIYANCRQWVPMFDLDYRNFYRRRHPFFAHAKTEFLLVRRAREVVARVLMIENERYNEQHGRNTAHFYFIDFTDDVEVADVLFSRMAEWARERGLNQLIGPLFSGATYGGGVLVHGFEHRAAMTMMPYNHAYYASHYERHGFSKHFDLFSLIAEPSQFVLPEKVERLADHVRHRGRMKVLQFESKSDLRRVAHEVGRLYNPTLADHHENYPLTDEELDQLIRELLQLAQPDLEKVITYDGEVIGFMLGFPDITEAIQKSRGRLTPLSILRLLRQTRTTNRLILNGMGILEKYQRLGGNALVYSEIARTIRDTPSYNFAEAELVQINEETELMLSDMHRLGARTHKIHRVFKSQLEETV